MITLSCEVAWSLSYNSNNLASLTYSFITIILLEDKEEEEDDDDDGKEPLLLLLLLIMKLSDSYVNWDTFA